MFLAGILAAYDGVPLYYLSDVFIYLSTVSLSLIRYLASIYEQVDNTCFDLNASGVEVTSSISG